MAEVLPPPTVPMMGDINGSGPNDAPLLKFAQTNMILPPPDLKVIIGKTAFHVAKSATRQQFEDRLRESRRDDPKFSFLSPNDPYHAYYKFRVERIAAGEDDEETNATANSNAMDVDIPAAPVDEGDEPPIMQYSLDIPMLPALDLDLMKLTALFTAQRGRSFLAALSQKEGRNYQFDFLRPASTLFGLFNRMVEQYKLVLLPPPEALEKVNEVTQPEGKWKTLEQTRRHAKWERMQREKAKQREDDKEAERVAFTEIDWHEFAIVQTIEFSAADAVTELPLPMTIQQMESRALAERRMAAMVMEDTAEDFERAKETVAAREAADMAQKESDAEALEAQRRLQREAEELAREESRARELQAKNLEGAGPMRIKTDYVPKTLVDKAANKVTYTTCQICHQQIPTHELEEHMRIELLDPRWKTLRDTNETRRAQGKELQRGANVAGSLKTLARKRPDLFGAEETEEARKLEEAEELAKRKEKEKVVWDGHLASKTGTMDKYQLSVNLDEQIAAIHRAKGLAQIDASAIGPSIGPAAVPVPISLPPPPASLPANPTTLGSEPTFTAATVMAAPQPSSSAPLGSLPIQAPAPVPSPVPTQGQPQASMSNPAASMFNLVPGQPQPVVLPPLHYQGLSSSQPFGYAPPPPGSRASGSGAGPKAAGQVAGTVRTADEMLDGDLAGGPAAKRAKVGRLPDGSLYPEERWMEYHPDPVTVKIKLPDYADKPEWKLDGSSIEIHDVALSSLVSTLRDLILNQLGSSVPLSRIRLQMGTTTLTNSKTLASYNVLDGEEILFELRRR